ncbi:MAG: FHA domain-containing protein [Verrucomicrobia bacterium]|nr:FHA domain-containing protein [Verrucomicrobiota bacterium]MBV8483149.1 FHA domain-containing protein [Verrucomicrobiota bacterium]
MKSIQIAVVSGLPLRSETFSTDNIIVGRAADVDLVLNHPEVSRRHCRLSREGDEWFIEDLESRRGTVVNGNRLSSRVTLRPGDQIRIGPVTVAFGVSSEERSAIWDAAPPVGAIRYQGESVDLIPLKANLVFGRGDEVDIDLNDPSVSRRHAKIELGPDGFRLFDLNSKTGAFVNGRRFVEHDLVIGDQIQLGSFCFLYDGKNCRRVPRVSVGRIVAVDLTKEGESGPILRQASFVAAPGQFIGILGPSGAGKTTLLNALSGLKPADGGKILIDQTDFYANLDRLRSLFGYVPQDDIVHADLTISQALTFAARLRLPAGTPRREIAKLVNQTISNLGLSDRANAKVDRLSGGQRKRVSVGVELLSRPPILFLDEPTSGLDPLAEFKVMELLRRLADNGCTVICTTHVMENVYLMDQVAIVSYGRVLFEGLPEEARAAFGVSRLTGLYGALQTREPQSLPNFQASLPPEIERSKPEVEPPPRPKKALSLPILLERQIAIFRADIKNPIMLLAQPMIIGVLVAFATNDAPLTQFYTYIATLWFGSSNSAQEIVRELPIYRRERLVGLSRWSYLASKFLWMGGLTTFQSLLLFVVIFVIHLGVHGAWQWQVLGLILLAFASTGIGLTISTFARSAIQAVMLVPLFLIPQIVFSGFSPPAYMMSPPILWVSQIMPSFASERVADVSFLIDQKITGDLITNYLTPYSNINNWYRSITKQRLLNGAIYTEKRPLWVAYLSLILWTLGGFAVSSWLLARKERA